jgi:hypothetical protein
MGPTDATRATKVHFPDRFQPIRTLISRPVGGLFDANATPPAGMPPQQLLVDYVRVYQKP